MSQEYHIPLDCTNGISIGDMALFEKAEQYFKGKSDVEMVIRKQRKGRSNDQNGYYWGVVIKMIADHCGYGTREELQTLHDYLRGKFLHRTITLENSSVDIVLSTTALTTVEFEKYQEDIRMWASIKLDLYIPLPNECQIPDSYVSC